MTFNEAKNEYVQGLEQTGITERTINYRVWYLDYFFEFLKKENALRVQDITPDHILRYQIEVEKKSWKTNTKAHAYGTTRSFFRFLYSQDVIFYDLSLIVWQPKQEKYLPQDVLTEEEIKKFLSLPDVSALFGIRDRAVLETFYSSGIRREELVRLDLYDFNEKNGTLRVIGKGNKERVVPIGENAVYWIKEYLQEVRLVRAKPHEQSLFVSYLYGERMEVQFINQIFMKYRKLGRFKKKISPHTFRHACATHMLKAGADVRYIQELLGHNSARTTEIYTHLDVSDLKKTLKTAHPREQAHPDNVGKNLSFQPVTKWYTSPFKGKSRKKSTE